MSVSSSAALTVFLMVGRSGGNLADLTVSRMAVHLAVMTVELLALHWAAPMAWLMVVRKVDLLVEWTEAGLVE